ncbi:hypothetical protein KEH51_19160 [[Brevibacterium] frigoritolerans]|uniref:Uncharacterized protein n=1 Tax=Peribacillus frigoritolerans TaxID=450367 RepID=A0A941FRW4_9BACI|nr:hypothetical protein [Peribacillus frigoritolerans]
METLHAEAISSVLVMSKPLVAKESGYIYDSFFGLLPLFQKYQPSFYKDKTGFTHLFPMIYRWYQSVNITFDLLEFNIPYIINRNINWSG